MVVAGLNWGVQKKDGKSTIKGCVLIDWNSHKNGRKKMKDKKIEFKEVYLKRKITTIWHA